jgi:hypothetical protein
MKKAMMMQCYDEETKKQTVVARSSTEDEYRVMANTTCELGWYEFSLGVQVLSDKSYGTCL